jgi:predicted PurR-regulated permease PerM
MLILRIPYVATISVLVGFTALIPVFGAFIGTILGAFLIFMVSPLKALIFIIFILILQQFEGNLIYPKVVGKSVNLPGIWVLVAVTIGASVSGIVGMLISVPIVSVCYSILATNVNDRLENKGKIRPKKLDKTKLIS